MEGGDFGGTGNLFLEWLHVWVFALQLFVNCTFMFYAFF